MTSPDVNAEQREHWNADESRHWVIEQDRYDRMLAPFGRALIETASLQPDDRVIDIGCGTGATTCDAALVVTDGGALGVDISQPMIEAARERATLARLSNARFEVGDAQTYGFEPDSAHVVVSRFGVMFFDDPVAAFANAGAALRERGRLVFACWQDLARNDYMLVPGMAAAAHVPLPDLGAPGAPGPFSLSDPDHINTLLEDAGFDHIAVEPHHASMLVGGGGSLADAVEFLRGTGMARALFADAPADVVERAIEAVTEALLPYLTEEGVRLDGSAWLVIATR